MDLQGKDHLMSVEGHVKWENTMDLQGKDYLMSRSIGGHLEQKRTMDLQLYVLLKCFYSTSISLNSLLGSFDTPERNIKQISVGK